MIFTWHQMEGLIGKRELELIQGDSQPPVYICCGIMLLQLGAVVTLVRPHLQPRVKGAPKNMNHSNTFDTIFVALSDQRVSLMTPLSDHTRKG